MQQVSEERCKFAHKLRKIEIWFDDGAAGSKKEHFYTEHFYESN